MSREYPTAGMWSRRDERPVRTALPGGAERRTGLTDERDAARWLASQDRGWRDGDRLSFAVLEADDVGGCVLIRCRPSPENVVDPDIGALAGNLLQCIEVQVCRYASAPAG